MSIEPEFFEMMDDMITLVPFLNFDFHGEAVYDTANPRFYRCRIVGKGLSIRRREGEEDAIIVDIYADTGGDRLTLQDMIVLPEDDAWIDRTPVIFSLGRFKDDISHHHTKIQCGWMYHRQGQ